VGRQNAVDAIEIRSNADIQGQGNHFLVLNGTDNIELELTNWTPKKNNLQLPKSLISEFKVAMIPAKID